MDNANIVMKMPTNYVDMNASELKFDGGWSWKTFGKVALIVGAVAAVGGLTVLLSGAILGAGAAAGGFAAAGALATSQTLVTAGLWTLGAGTAAMVGGGVSLGVSNANN